MATAFLLVVAAITAVAAPARAPHRPELVSRCVYEVGTTVFVGVSVSDPTGLTEDENVNVGGCGWTFPDADPGGEDPLTDVVGGNLVVRGEYSQAQASVTDDIFGPAVGADIASDADHDHTFGEEDEDEFRVSFCGTSPLFTSDVDHDGDGHPDLAFELALFLNGPVRQALNCDPFANPVGATTGGILDPAGGVFMTLAG